MASAAEQLAANMNFASFQKATELHKRIWFTIIALVVYRLGTYVPIPGIDVAAFANQICDALILAALPVSRRALANSRSVAMKRSSMGTISFTGSGAG